MSTDDEKEEGVQGTNTKVTGVVVLDSEEEVGTAAINMKNISSKGLDNIPLDMPKKLMKWTALHGNGALSAIVVEISVTF